MRRWGCRPRKPISIGSHELSFVESNASGNGHVAPRLFGRLAFDDKGRKLASAHEVVQVAADGPAVNVKFAGEVGDIRFLGRAAESLQ